jgi:hypothetical protein
MQGAVAAAADGLIVSCRPDERTRACDRFLGGSRLGADHGNMGKGGWKMATPLLELEGTWEEIQERIPDFAGQRVRLIIWPAPESEAGTSERDLAADLAHLRKLLEQGKVEEARGRVRALARRWPAAEQICRLAQVLAPPVVSQRPDVRPRPLDRERAWLREHAHAYPGHWLAVLEDRLIAADADLRVVLARVRETSGGEQALLHYQPGSAE